MEYCCTSPQPAQGQNISSNPLFVNSSANDFRLQSSSPCIDAGSSAGAPGRDALGIPRPLDGDGVNGAQHDMGAFEYVPPSGSVVVRINPVHAVDAGAAWSLDGLTWYDSDHELEYVRQGSYTISFANVNGWARPDSHTISVSAGSLSAPSATYLPLSNDTDGDGIPDDYEIRLTGRLYHLSFDGDYDGDGMSDYYEWLSGTDPTDPLSCLIFNEGALSLAPGGGITLRWYSGAGMSFTILRSTNLVDGFSEIDSGVTATPPMNFYTDPDPIESGARFYKIKLDD